MQPPLPHHHFDTDFPNGPVWKLPAIKSQQGFKNCDVQPEKKSTVPAHCTQFFSLDVTATTMATASGPGPSYAYYESPIRLVGGQVGFVSEKLDMRNDVKGSDEKYMPKVGTYQQGRAPDTEKKGLELGLGVECKYMRYMLTRYDYKDLGFKQKPDEQALKKMDKDELPAYMISNLPELKWKDARIQTKIIENLDRETLASQQLLLKEIRVFGSKEEAGLETLQFLPKPNFKLSKLKTALRCPCPGKKRIEMDVFVLNENKAVLTVEKWTEQLKQRGENSLWKLLKHDDTSAEVSKTITLCYEMSSESMSPEWRNQIRTPSPKPGLKEEFDLTEASEKVITLLSRVLLTNTWATLSPNIYGKKP